MSSKAGIAGKRQAQPSGSSNLLGRIAAIIEVLLVFSLVHVAYRSFKHFTELGRLEGVSGLNFSPGTTMFVFSVIAVLVHRKSFEEYGLTLKGWRYNLNVGLIWGVLITLAAAVVIHLHLVHFDPLHPPDVTRAVVFSAGELILTVLLALFLMRERSVVRAIPPSVSLLVLAALVSLPLVLAINLHRGVTVVLLRTLWLFFGAGFGEEIFFRGYVQSRLNQAFGRPWQFVRVRFGVGLIASALLFGFIHALNTVEYFEGRYDFAWLWTGTNFIAGLFFGCLRDRTESVAPGAIIHGVTDVLAEVPGLLG
jgi:uncharacterized protein